MLSDHEHEMLCVCVPLVYLIIYLVSMVFSISIVNMLRITGVIINNSKYNLPAIGK